MLDIIKKCFFSYPDYRYDKLSSMLVFPNDSDFVYMKFFFKHYADTISELAPHCALVAKDANFS